MNPDSIPAQVRQLVENMFTMSNPEHIRYNYLMMIKNIRDFCQQAIDKYERQIFKK